MSASSTWSFPALTASRMTSSACNVPDARPEAERRGLEVSLEDWLQHQLRRRLRDAVLDRRNLGLIRFGGRQTGSSPDSDGQGPHRAGGGEAGVGANLRG